MIPLFSRALRSVVLLVSIAAPLLLNAANVRVYVQFNAGKSASAHNLLSIVGALTHHEFPELNAIAVTIPEQARDALARNPAISFIEDDPVRGFLAQSTPYGINLVQAPPAVAAGATGAGIKVGVIDSGVYRAHEDLQGVTLTGEPDYGAADERTWYNDALSHGTHVVGTITAANNSLGVVGVSPGKIAIHLVKVFGNTGNWVYSSDLVAAARAAYAKGCKIISMSLGGPTYSSTESAAFGDLYARGVLLVAAAGNDGNTATSYPAGYASVISVAAINSSKVVATFSQKNADVELAAPGVGVLSTVSYTSSTPAANRYAYFDGTSMATPHVAGVAALIWSKYPTTTNAQVRQALDSTAQDLGTVGRDTSYGYGLVQASSALNALAKAATTPTTADTTAPVISNVAGTVTSATAGTFQITWTTNEPATSDVQINGTTFPDATLVTSHLRAFTGTIGGTYTYTVISADAAGNKATSGPRSLTIR